MSEASRSGASWRLMLCSCAVLMLLVVQVGCAVNPVHGRSPAVRLAIPIDADSREVWSVAIAGAPLVGIIILNPSNGPGQSVDASYAQLVAEAQAKGISVLGYVYTQWASGQVSIQQAEGMIDQYYSWYHVDGIMLDEASDSCSAVPLQFYATLYNYIKAKPAPATVLLNPGKATGGCYAAVSDVLLTFENDYANYLGHYASANWTTKIPPSHFFHIVFDVPNAAEMQNAVSMSAARGAGWIYVTNLNNSKGNPYSSLPSYFDRELAFVGQLDDSVRPYTVTTSIMLILGLTAAGSALVMLGRWKKAADQD